MKKIKSEVVTQKGQIFFCIFAVLFLVLLLCGDMIVTQFLPVNPNQDYFIENQEKSVFLEIDVDDFFPLLKNESTFFLLIGKKEEEEFQDYIQKLSLLFDQESKKYIYFIDSSFIDTKESYFEFLSISGLSKEQLEKKTTFLVFQNGICQQSFSVSFEEIFKIKNKVEEYQKK